MFIDNPVGVGYSTVRRDRELNHNDASFAKDALAFIKKFYQDYPEYLHNELYVTGISYGGIYAPLLTLEIHNYNQELKINDNDSNSPNAINLKGFFAFNGITDYRYDPHVHAIDVISAFNLIPISMLEEYKSENCRIIWGWFWEVNN